MNTRDRRRRTWWCRLAERLDVVTGVDDGGSDSPLHRRARRHVDHCAYCRAEREAWARVQRRLRALERPMAPDGLLDGVMARIALERSRGGEARARTGAHWATGAAVHSPTATAAHARTDAAHFPAHAAMHPRARAEGHPASCAAADGLAPARLRAARGAAVAANLAAAGLGGVGLAASWAMIRRSMDPVSPPSAALTDTARELVLEAFHSLNALAMQAGSAGQLSAALVWGLTGLAVALAVSVATETIVSD